LLLWEGKIPFKSKAQRRKFYAMKTRGEMTQAKIDEWESETPKHIPERKKKKKHKKTTWASGG